MRKNTIIYLCLIALFIANQSCKKDTNITSSDPDTISGKMVGIDSTNIDTSLLCYLPFSGNLKDKSGHKNNGSLVGTLSYVSDRFGNASKAASFSASNTYIEIPEADFVGLKSLTIAMDFFPTSAARQLLFSKVSYNQPIGSPNFYQSLILVIQQNYFEPIQFNVKKEGYCQSANNGDWNPGLHYTHSFVLNQWNHLAITFNNSVYRMYLNGNLVLIGVKSPSPICQGEPIRLGVWWTADPLYYTGNMDEVRIYNRVLSAKEIRLLNGQSIQ